nr:MAG TPA: triphosphate pyrophosphohydrolase [Caudoviricetes sp.]
MAILRPLDQLVDARACGLKLLEEASEACEELKKYEKVLDLMTDELLLATALLPKMASMRDSALHELCDVLQVVANCLYALDVTPQELDNVVLDVRFGNYRRCRSEVNDAYALKLEWREIDRAEDDEIGDDDADTD